MIIQILLAVLGMAAFALALALIEDWIRQNRTQRSSYAEVLKRRLESGQYRVVANVIDRTGTTEATKTWTVEELDEDLQSKFGYADSFTVSL